MVDRSQRASHFKPAVVLALTLVAADAAATGRPKIAVDVSLRGVEKALTVEAAVGGEVKLRARAVEALKSAVEVFDFCDSKACPDEPIRITVQISDQGAPWPNGPLQFDLIATRGGRALASAGPQDLRFVPADPKPTLLLAKDDWLFSDIRQFIRLGWNAKEPKDVRPMFREVDISGELLLRRPAPKQFQYSLTEPAELAQKLPVRRSTGLAVMSVQNPAKLLSHRFLLCRMNDDRLIGIARSKQDATLIDCEDEAQLADANELQPLINKKFEVFHLERMIP